MTVIGIAGGIIMIVLAIFLLILAIGIGSQGWLWFAVAVFMVWLMMRSCWRWLKLLIAEANGSAPTTPTTATRTSETSELPKNMPSALDDPEWI